LGVKLEITGGCRKQIGKIKAIANQTLGAIDKCLTIMPNMKSIKLGMLENIWKMICESSLLCGLEIWGVAGGWELVFWVQGISCKKMLRTLEVWPPVAAESELGIESWKEDMMEYGYKIWGHCEAEWEGGTSKTVLGRAGW